MIKIGEFSKLSFISVRMLRHYEKIGLLYPRYVDDSSGYRYYSSSQLLIVSKINLLKSMGFSLNSIKELSDDITDNEKLKEYLHTQKELVTQENETIKQRLVILESTITKLDKETNIMEYIVTLKEIPKRKIGSVRQVIDGYNDEGKLWNYMGEEFEKQNVKIASPCYSIAVFHDVEHKEVDVDVEVQLSVEGDYKSTDKITFKEVDAVQVASAMLEGDYSKIIDVNKAIYEWISDNDYNMNGPMFTINHVSPATESDPDKLVTELCFPVIKDNSVV